MPGKPWQEELEKALEVSRTCAVFLSQGKEPWQHLEMQAALNRQSHDTEFRIIPVLLPGAPDPEGLPSFLKLFTVVDFRRGLDDQDAYQYGQLRS